MIRCPACRADNERGPACRRCKADLSMLFALEARREGLLAQARIDGAAGRWQQAYSAASEADALRRDEASLRLVAVAALFCRDFHQAWRNYLAARQEGSTPAGPG